jgi:hypothetical protein
VAFVVISETGSAQGIRIRIGDKIYCVISCEGHVLVTADPTMPDADGELLTGTGSGNAEFECVASNGDDPDAGITTSSSFKPNSLSISGNDATYGFYTFQYDASRPAPNSVVTANQFGSDFPATSVVQANVTGTVSGLPGVYANSTPCRISTNTLTSFNPHIGQQYKFDNDVVFVNVDDPAALVFVIKAGAAVILN